MQIISVFTVWDNTCKGVNFWRVTWVFYNYLEEITFSLSIRPHHTTHFSAFELIKLWEYLALLYPGIVSSIIAEDDVIEQVDSLHKFQLQNQEIAGRSSNTLQIINESMAWQKNKPRYWRKSEREIKYWLKIFVSKRKVENWKISGMFHTLLMKFTQPMF